MCVMSMVMDHYYDRWWPRRVEPLSPYIQPVMPFPIAPVPMTPFPSIPEPAPLITQEELNEFRQLLERAREYDRKHNQPDCELDEKKEKLQKLAEELGVKISFD